MNGERRRILWKGGNLRRYKSKPHMLEKRPWQSLTTDQEFGFTVVGSTDYNDEAVVFSEIRVFYKVR